MTVFEPMPEALRVRLRELCGMAQPGTQLRLAALDERDEGLEALGMIDVGRRYLDGGGLARVTWRGATYEADLAAWEAERSQARAAEVWKASQERAEAFERDERARRHDWHTTAFTAACSAATGILGVVLGWFLGHVGIPF